MNYYCTPLPRKNSCVRYWRRWTFRPVGNTQTIYIVPTYCTPNVRSPRKVMLIWFFKYLICNGNKTPTRSNIRSAYCACFSHVWRVSSNYFGPCGFSIVGKSEEVRYLTNYRFSMRIYSDTRHSVYNVGPRALTSASTNALPNLPERHSRLLAILQ